MNNSFNTIKADWLNQQLLRKSLAVIVLFAIIYTVLRMLGDERRATATNQRKPVAICGKQAKP
jgi:branched-subunit amino acid permease